jgi:DNA primase
MLEKITEACKFLLNNYPGAAQVREYLDSRLTKESQDRFQFGYYPGWEEISLLTDMVGEDIIVEHNLIYYKDIEDSLFPRSIPFSYFDKFSLVMPFRDVYGKTVGLVARTLLSDENMKEAKIPKYKNTKNFEKGRHLFGLYENKKSIFDKGMVFVVEGQFDVIKANERGIDNIVALGTCNMTPYQFSLICRYTDNIGLLLDNDDGGEKGRKAIISKFGNMASIHNFYLPEIYKDIDEYLTKEKDCNVDNIALFVK